MSHRNPNLRSEVNKDIRVLCTHVFEGGHTCTSPALRDETFCYYHHPTRRRAETRAEWRIARRSFSVPTPTDREQFLDILTCVVQAIADDRVKIPHARRILYALQQASLNLQTTESAGGQKNFHPHPKPAILKANHLYHVARPT